MSGFPFFLLVPDFKNGINDKELLEIMPFYDNAAVKYGEIRAMLEKQGNTIGAFDLLIAAHALSLDAILVTNNVREFKRISGLKVENWV